MSDCLHFMYFHHPTVYYTRSSQNIDSFVLVAQTYQHLNHFVNVIMQSSLHYFNLFGFISSLCTWSAKRGNSESTVGKIQVKFNLMSIHFGEFPFLA